MSKSCSILIYSYESFIIFPESKLNGTEKGKREGDGTWGVGTGEDSIKRGRGTEKGG